jgi:alpha-D-ribose 1-methylphosphonate 5-triphosphate synthase subunit PhnH
MTAPGFADPVLDAQAAFRALLTAMAYPGRIVELPGLPEPQGLPASMAALALALCDQDTPLWHDAGAAVAEWLGFHTGAPTVPAGLARFLLATGAPPPLAGLSLGTDEAPQEGATLLVAVDALDTAPGWRLRGPGIAHETSLHVRGLPAGLVAERAALAAHFPRGLDIVLCCGARIAALPRTTRIEEAR